MKIEPVCEFVPADDVIATVKSGVDTDYCVIDTLKPVTLTGFNVSVTGFSVMFTDYPVFNTVKPVTLTMNPVTNTD